MAKNDLKHKAIQFEERVDEAHATLALLGKLVKMSVPEGEITEEHPVNQATANGLDHLIGNVHRTLRDLWTDLHEATNGWGELE